MSDKIKCSAKVEMFKGRPTLFINDEPTNPEFHSLTDCPGGRWTWEEMPRWNLNNFAKIGFKLYQVDLWLEHMWFEDGSFSVEMAKKQLRGIMDVCDQPAVFIRLHVNPPRWWLDRHPEECVGYEGESIIEEPLADWGGLRRPLEGDLINFPRVSLASAEWLAVASEKLGLFCQLMANEPEGDCLAGIQPACGVYGEWHYWGFIDHVGDTGIAMTSHFRKWLKQKYGNVETLSAAWNSPEVSFDTATVPGKDERKHLEDGIFRNPQTQRKVSDYYECQHQAVADDIIQFCKVCKENWPRPLVTGTFYGYFFNLFGKQAAGGHLEPHRVLESEYVDYLSAPQAYGDKHFEIGCTGQSRGVLESCRVNGKLWLDEMDTYTMWGYPHDMPLKMSSRTMQENIALIRRNVAQSFTRGMGLWYYDFGPTLVSGWWDHPVLLDAIGNMKALFDRYYKKELAPQADVLLVYDTRCFYYLAEQDPVIDPVAINMAAAAVFHSGAAFDMIFLTDLQKVDLSQYRTVIFGNTLLLSDSEREFIRSRVASNGRHVVFYTAPGYTNGQRNSDDFISDVTGIHVVKGKCPDNPQVVWTAEPKMIAASGTWGPCEPFFVTEDPEAEVVGELAGSGESAMVKKKLGDSVVWFSSIPITSSDVLRSIFRESGAHIHNDDGDVIYSGSGILAIHTKDGGLREITLKNGKKVHVTLEPISTTFLDNETGEWLK
ncbi:MAG: hypothetical protein H7X86_03260 [Gorillibacterium sp.]|nr:hypothetical protein [Gorillibacterium sp.]